MSTTKKFGYRSWSASGELLAEYWISDIDLVADVDDGEGATTPVFRAGSLAHLHERRDRNNSIDDSQNPTPRSLNNHGSNHDRHLDTSHDSHHSSSAHPQRRKPEFLTHTFKSAGAAKSKRRLFSRRRHYQPSISSDQASSSASSISTHSMSLTTQTTMASTPASEKRKSGFLHRIGHGLGHSRRKSSVDVTAQSPQTRTSAAARPPSQRAATTATTIRPSNTALQPQAVNGISDAPPQIVIRSPTARLEDSEEVHYPEGLNTAPLSPGQRSNRGITWAQDYEEGPPRPRRTSSAATHGRRSSIYSKDVDGNFDNVLGVEAGVGSKARRLSVALPDDLQVDECSLEEHFSYLQRMKHKEIGQGGAAVVKLMQSKTAGSSSDKVYAVKEFRLRDAAEESEYEYERKIKSEFAISRACEHPNIVKTFRLCHSGDQWYHVMEYCELGDLNDLINQGNFRKPEDRNCMFKQLVRGVDYLHSRGIAHRDLKSENVLVNKQGCLKIADFGTGEVFCGQHPGVRNCRRQSIIDPNEPIRKCSPGLVGSTPYMAPEIYQRHGKYDPRAVDVWAVAIVYVTLCFGGNPWDAAGQDCKNFRIFMQTWEAWFEQHEDHIIRDGRPVPKFGYMGNMACLDDQETRVMLMGMLHPEPEKRWNIRQVLESKPVVEAPCCQQEGYSDDIKTRQKKSLHNHIPENMRKRLKGKP